MASGDVRQNRGRGGGGGGSVYHYDDMGRGNSMELWSWFSTYYGVNQYKDECLFLINDETCYKLVNYSTSRFNLEDITNMAWHDDERAAAEDSRAARLIRKESPAKNATWVKFHAYMIDGYMRHKKVLEEERKKQQEGWEKRQEAYRIAREAEVVRLQRELEAKVNNIVELTAGSLRSDFAAAFETAEVHNQYQGDELDDVVDGYATGRGYSEEVRRPGGVKLQITLSIDLSNSMYYNRIHDAATNAFYEIGIALKQMKIEHPENVHIAFFTFSDGTDGKYAGILTKDGTTNKVGSWYDTVDRYENTKLIGDEVSSFELTQFSGMRNSYNVYQGEDTWISPLFEQIELWELKYSDTGAVRLDIIITDAVLEHKSDILEADKIQERRDGNLQTVLLNFMPESQWSTGTLPKRCVQYGADKSNISGMLRQIVSEFIAVNL